MSQNPTFFISSPKQDRVFEVGNAPRQGNSKEINLTIYIPTKKALGVISSLTVNDQLTFKKVCVLLTNPIMK